MSRYRLETIAEQFRNKTVGILGNGPTVIHRNQDGSVVGKADFSAFPHPIWSINGGWHYHPQSQMGFLMDDIKGPAVDDHPTPDWYLDLIRHSQIPILTSKAHEDFPALVEFPLADVMRFFRIGYFAESINYMIAFAAMIGVERIEFYGADYMNARPQERASTEFWAGVAHGLGLAKRYWREVRAKDPKLSRAIEKVLAIMPDGIENAGCEIVVSPASEFMKARYDESYYMPGFYGYNKETFPLIYESRGGPECVNVKLDARYDGKWWKPVTKKAA